MEMIIAIYNPRFVQYYANCKHALIDESDYCHLF